MDKDLVAVAVEALWNLDGELPISIAVAWEASGDKSWSACADARDLLRLIAYADRRMAVTGACACARTALHRVPAGELRSKQAIETAEAWVKGEATAAEALAAAEASAYVDSSASSAAYAAWCGDFGIAIDVVVARHALSAYAGAAADNAARQSHSVPCSSRALNDLATLVRSVTTCPTLAQLAVRTAA